MDVQRAYMFRAPVYTHITAHTDFQACALIGDFSGWKEVWMTKDKWGVWSVTLPDGEWLHTIHGWSVCHSPHTLSRPQPT